MNLLSELFSPSCTTALGNFVKNSIESPGKYISSHFYLGYLGFVECESP